MESIKFIEGYGKVNPLEDPTSQFPNHHAPQKRRLTIVISLLLLLTVAIGAMIAALIHESTTEPPEPSPSLTTNSTQITQSIRVVCSVTQYPDSCYTAISAVNSPLTPLTDPEVILSLSVQVAVNELTNLSSLPKTLISKSNDLRAESALRDCTTLFGDAVSQLNNSVTAIRVGPGEKVLTEEKIGDLKTWISAAMSDQETCLDGLEEMGSTVLDEVKAKVQKSKEYMSNTLAILANIHSLLDKFGLKMH